MNTALLVPLIAAAASIAAAAVSVWQARVAGGQARSALRQAASSEQQVKLMREQFEDVRQERERHGFQQRRDKILEYAGNANDLSVSMNSVKTFLAITLLGVYADEINREVDKQHTASAALLFGAERIVNDLDAETAERFSEIHVEIMENYSKFNTLYRQLIHRPFNGAGRRAEIRVYAERIDAKVVELIELVD
jgi:hypothetical protein